MYLGLLWNNGYNKETIDYLLSFSEIEKTEQYHIFNFDLKGLRKLKIQSLHDQEIKTNLEKLQKLINDKTQIHIYGDKMPIIEYGTTGSSGTDGCYGSIGTGLSNTGTFGYSNKSEYVRPIEMVTDYLSMINEILD